MESAAVRKRRKKKSVKLCSKKYHYVKKTSKNKDQATPQRKVKISHNTAASKQIGNLLTAVAYDTSLSEEVCQIIGNSSTPNSTTNHIMEFVNDSSHSQIINVYQVKKRRKRNSKSVALCSRKYAYRKKHCGTAKLPVHDLWDTKQVLHGSACQICPKDALLCDVQGTQLNQTAAPQVTPLKGDVHPLSEETSIGNLAPTFEIASKIPEMSRTFNLLCKSFHLDGEACQQSTLQGCVDFNPATESEVQGFMQYNTFDILGATKINGEEAGDNGSSLPKGPKCVENSIFTPNSEMIQREKACAGFKNQGNTCFMAACIQALLHIPAMVTWLMQDKTHRQTFPSCMCFVCALAKLNQQHKAYSVVDPLGFIYALKNGSVALAAMFDGLQHDAHEFLTLFYMELNDHYLKRYNSFVMEGQTKAEVRSPLSQIFAFKMTEKFTCLHCGLTHDGPSYVNSQLHLKSIGSVQAAVDEYLYEEVTVSFCMICGKDFEQKKIIYLDTQPAVLVVLLSRFTETMAKNITAVEINEVITLDRIQYKMLTAIIHNGSTSASGHYTNVSRWQKKNHSTWTLFNDMKALEVTDPHHIASFKNEAYILFYQREELNLRDLCSELVFIKGESTQGYLGDPTSGFSDIQPLSPFDSVTTNMEVSLGKPSATLSTPSPKSVISQGRPAKPQQHNAMWHLYTFLQNQKDEGISMLSIDYLMKHILKALGTSSVALENCLKEVDEESSYFKTSTKKRSNLKKFKRRFDNFPKTQHLSQGNGEPPLPTVFCTCDNDKEARTCTIQNIPALSLPSEERTHRSCNCFLCATEKCSVCKGEPDTAALALTSQLCFQESKEKGNSDG